MTVEIDRDALIGVLREVVSVVPGRTTIPVLANVLLEASSGVLAVTATDLDLQVTATVEAAGDLSITVPADKIVAAAQSMRPGRITLETLPNRASTVRMKQGKGQRTIPGIKADDFPKRPAINRSTHFSISVPALSRLLDTTHVAQSTEEARYYLIGVFLHMVDGKLCAAATDGHRLVRCSVDAPEEAKAMPDSIVGTKTVTLLRRLLGKAEGAIDVEVTDRAIVCRIGRATVSANLVAGTFPDYQRVIPPVGRTGLRVNCAELSAAAAGVVSVVAASGNDKVRTVRVEIGAGDEHELTASDIEGGDASEHLAGEAIGAPIVFGLNQKYLQAVLGVFGEAANVELSLSDPTSAVRITADTDPDLIAVVMPLRV